MCISAHGSCYFQCCFHQNCTYGTVPPSTPTRILYVRNPRGFLGANPLPRAQVIVVTRVRYPAPNCKHPVGPNLPPPPPLLLSAMTATLAWSLPPTRYTTSAGPSCYPCRYRSSSSATPPQRRRRRRRRERRKITVSVSVPTRPNSCRPPQARLRESRSGRWEGWDCRS